MKEPSSTLPLGPAIEATATKTKTVACLGSVVKPRTAGYLGRII